MNMKDEHWSNDGIIVLIVEIIIGVEIVLATSRGPKWTNIQYNAK